MCLVAIILNSACPEEEEKLFFIESQEWGCFPRSPPADFPRCLFGQKSVTYPLLNQILARNSISAGGSE